MNFELLSKLPKSDLHVHLDGSLRIPTLIELARKQGITLPSYEEAGLRELVFKKHYRDLPDYLAGFSYTCAVLREAEAIERCSFELCEDAIAEGVRYMEVRFSPQLLSETGGGCVRALKAVARGCERAAQQHGAPDGIPFEWGIIVCSMRNLARGMSPYFDTLMELLPNMTQKELASVASIAAVRAAVEARDLHGVPVVGVDLAGAEDGYRPKYHREAYREAHQAFMHKTVHAGEAYGPESIYEAITACHADRIGHGTFLFSPEKIADAAGIVNKDAYVRALVEHIAARRLTLEVCPTSNLQTLPVFENDIRKHPLRQMLVSELSVVIATDNRLVSDTTVTRELAIVSEGLELSPEAVKKLVLAGFKAAFFPKGYVAKREFVKKVAERLESIYRENGL